ncbi:MAG: sigma-70 family RNA polymerase sigma factor [Bacteroidales bacterium]|nr:sigma-70 family RNA polymerase sigma factor [Bacteroidales bacterium]
MISSAPYESVKSKIETISDFDAMLLRNKAMLWHICSDYNLGKDYAPEDCMQEVMISLWRSYGTFEGRSSEKTWVWRVASNTMLMLRRKAEHTLATETLNEDDESATESDPNDERLRQLNQLIDTLPEENATIIRAFLDGFSYKEIADMTGNSVGAVAMRIARSKHKLKQMYEKENAF